MHEQLFRFFLAIVASKLAFLMIAFGAGWPAWAIALEAVLILGAGVGGLVLAYRARRDARWDGVLPLSRGR